MNDDTFNMQNERRAQMDRTTRTQSERQQGGKNKEEHSVAGDYDITTLE